MDLQSDQGGTAVQPDQGTKGTSAQVETQAKVTFAGKDYFLDKPEDVKALEDDTNRLNKEFHKRNQEKPAEPAEPDQLEELTNLIAPKLAERGYVTQDEMKLQNLLALNPALRAKETELRDLANLPSNKGKAYEDIAEQYHLSGGDKLVKAKSSEVKGEPIPKEPTQTKSLKDLTSEEYAQWKAENLGKTPKFTKK